MPTHQEPTTKKRCNIRTTGELRRGRERERERKRLPDGEKEKEKQ